MVTIILGKDCWMIEMYLDDLSDCLNRFNNIWIIGWDNEFNIYR